MARRRKDFYYRMAKKEGYRSRAAYKLSQMQLRFKIMRKGDTVVDLGAAPGGWSQVAAEIPGVKVLAIDLQGIDSIRGVETIRADITDNKIAGTIRESAGRVNVVLCDAAPNLSGNWSYDHAKSVDLAEAALKISEDVLTDGGNFVVKVFQGDMFNSYLELVRRSFKKVKCHSPKASRNESAEMYIVAMGYDGGRD